jgi:hypothetical protein
MGRYHGHTFDHVVDVLLIVELRYTAVFLPGAFAFPSAVEGKPLAATLFRTHSLCLPFIS